MAWTYSNTLTTPRDRVRYLLGDTDTTAQLEQDETVNAAIVLYGEALGTATLAEGLASRFARAPDTFGADGLSVSWRERVQTWLTLASNIRSREASLAAQALAAASAVLGGSGYLLGSRGETLTSEYVRPYDFYTRGY